MYQRWKRLSRLLTVVAYGVFVKVVIDNNNREQITRTLVEIVPIQQARFPVLTICWRVHVNSRNEHISPTAGDVPFNLRLSYKTSMNVSNETRAELIRGAELRPDLLLLVPDAATANEFTMPYWPCVNIDRGSRLTRVTHGREYGFSVEIFKVGWGRGRSPLYLFVDNEEASFAVARSMAFALYTPETTVGKFAEYIKLVQKSFHFISKCPKTSESTSSASGAAPVGRSPAGRVDWRCMLALHNRSLWSAEARAKPAGEAISAAANLSALIAACASGDRSRFECWQKCLPPLLDGFGSKLLSANQLYYCVTVCTKASYCGRRYHIEQTQEQLTAETISADRQVKMFFGTQFYLATKEYVFRRLPVTYLSLLGGALGIFVPICFLDIEKLVEWIINQAHRTVKSKFEITKTLAVAVDSSVEQHNTEQGDAAAKEADAAEDEGLGQQPVWSQIPGLQKVINTDLPILMRRIWAGFVIVIYITLIIITGSLINVVRLRVETHLELLDNSNATIDVGLAVCRTHVDQHHENIAGDNYMGRCQLFTGSCDKNASLQVVHLKKGEKWHQSTLPQLGECAKELPIVLQISNVSMQDFLIFHFSMTAICGTTYRVGMFEIQGETIVLNETEKRAVNFQLQDDYGMCTTGEHVTATISRVLYEDKTNTNRGRPREQRELTTEKLSSRLDASLVKFSKKQIQVTVQFAAQVIERYTDAEAGWKSVEVFCLMGGWIGFVVGLSIAAFADTLTLLACNAITRRSDGEAAVSGRPALPLETVAVTAPPSTDDEGAGGGDAWTPGRGSLRRSTAPGGTISDTVDDDEEGRRKDAPLSSPGDRQLTEQGAAASAGSDEAGVGGEGVARPGAKPLSAPDKPQLDEAAAAIEKRTKRIKIAFTVVTSIIFVNLTYLNFEETKYMKAETSKLRISRGINRPPEQTPILTLISGNVIETTFRQAKRNKTIDSSHLGRVNREFFRRFAFRLPNKDQFENITKLGKQLIWRFTKIVHCVNLDTRRNDAMRICLPLPVTRIYLPSMTSPHRSVAHSAKSVGNWGKATFQMRAGGYQATRLFFLMVNTNNDYPLSTHSYTQTLHTSGLYWFRLKVNLARRSDPACVSDLTQLRAQKKRCALACYGHKGAHRWPRYFKAETALMNKKQSTELVNCISGCDWVWTAKLQQNPPCEYMSIEKNPEGVRLGVSSSTTVSFVLVGDRVTIYKQVPNDLELLEQAGIICGSLSMVMGVNLLTLASLLEPTVCLLIARRAESKTTAAARDTPDSSSKSTRGAARSRTGGGTRRGKNALHNDTPGGLSQETTAAAAAAVLPKTDGGGKGMQSGFRVKMRRDSL